MPYKNPCGFRDKINVCKFKGEDCSPEKCDMFNLEFTQKSIIERMRTEQAKVKEVNDRMQILRKERKTKEPEYKELYKQIADLCYGCAILSKAYVYCKRTRK